LVSASCPAPNRAACWRSLVRPLGVHQKRLQLRLAPGMTHELPQASVGLARKCTITSPLPLGPWWKAASFTIAGDLPRRSAIQSSISRSSDGFAADSKEAGDDRVGEEWEKQVVIDFGRVAYGKSLARSRNHDLRRAGVCKIQALDSSLINVSGCTRQS
jgi:hypothetical protein